MTVYTDNANKFATRADTHVDQLLHAGVHAAMKLLHDPKIPEDRRREAAWTTLVLSLDHQARAAGIVLEVAWWTKPLDPALVEVELLEKAS